MGRSAADHLSSLRREQSLLRSFSAIHRPPTELARDRHGRQSEHTRQGLRRRNKVGRRQSCPDIDLSPLLSPAVDLSPLVMRSPTGVARSPASISIVPGGRAHRQGCQGWDGKEVSAPARTAHGNDLLHPHPTLEVNDGGEKKVGGGDPIVETHGSSAAHDPPVQLEPATTTRPSTKCENTPGVSMRELSQTVSREDVPALPFPKASGVMEHRRQGSRQDYKLGDVLRALSHMIIQPTAGRAFRAVSALENYDFAFVKRSDGSFSYAILAYRSMEHIHKGAKTLLVECMNFVINGVGATKKVARGSWGKNVRLVSTEQASSRHPPRSEGTASHLLWVEGSQ